MSSTKKALSDEDIQAIVFRDVRQPGSWYSDASGSPVVVLSWGERFINRLPETSLYVRRKNTDGLYDETKRLREVADWLNKDLLTDAYQALQDRHLLLEEVARLRERVKDLEHFLLDELSALGQEQERGEREREQAAASIEQANLGESQGSLHLPKAEQEDDPEV